MPMRVKAIILVIILSIVTIGLFLIKLTPERGPKKLVPKFSFGRRGNGLGEFGAPRNLTIKDDYLFVAELDNNRIQILEIKPNGNLYPEFTFGKEGKGLGEFGELLPSLIIKKNYLYVSDPGNHRIQVLEIKY